MSVQYRQLRKPAISPRQRYAERRFSVGEAWYGMTKHLGAVAVSVSAAATSIFTAYYLPVVVGQRFEATATAVARAVCASSPDGSDDPVEVYTGGRQFLPSIDVGKGSARVEAAQRAALAAFEQAHIRRIIGIDETECVVIRASEQGLASQAQMPASRR